MPTLKQISKWSDRPRSDSEPLPLEGNYILEALRDHMQLDCFELKEVGYTTDDGGVVTMNCLADMRKDTAKFCATCFLSLPHVSKVRAIWMNEDKQPLVTQTFTVENRAVVSHID